MLDRERGITVDCVECPYCEVVSARVPVRLAGRLIDDDMLVRLGGRIIDAEGGRSSADEDGLSRADGGRSLSVWLEVVGRGSPNERRFT